LNPHCEAYGTSKVSVPSLRIENYVPLRMVGSRGFEPRSARSERAASANCATSRCGDHGRIRTATGQALNLLPLPGLRSAFVKPKPLRFPSLMLGVGLHGHWSLWVDSNHHLTG
jgi:hypothetical protein